MDTKTAIKNSFMDLYLKKDFSHISVSELCSLTPVARSTFYFYFDNTDSVKAEIENELIDGLMSITERISNGRLPEMDFLIFLDAIEEYIKNRWSFFYAFLTAQPNIRFINKWKDSIKFNFKRRYPNKADIKNYALISEMVASSVIGAYTFWMDNPNMVETNELKMLITKTLESMVNSL